MKFLNSGTVTPPNAPFSEGVVVGDIFYMSGQIGHIPRTMDLVPGGISAESVQVMENIKATLAAHGLTLNHLIKCTIMLADIEDWQKFNEVYLTYFEGSDLPARSAFGTNGLALNARVEVDCMAHYDVQGHVPKA